MVRPPFPSVLDSTILAAFRSCPRKAFLEFLLHWKNKEPSVHLHAGAAYARGMEVARKSFYEEGKDHETSVALGVGALLEFYGNFDCPEDSAKSASRTAGALEYYFSRYNMETDPAKPLTLTGGKKAIEFGGVEPLEERHPESGDPILYSWRMDMACEYEGMKLGEDDKTASQLGASWPRQWDLRCFSASHELYTRAGWVSIARLQAGTEILQSDAEGNLSFAVPTEYIVAPYTGDLLSIEGRRLSQLITPNHRVLLNRRRGGTVTVLAEELYKRDDKDAIPLAGRHTEERLPEDIQRFVVAAQADAKLQDSSGRVGSGRGHREHMPNRAIIFAFTKQRKAERLAALLVRLNIKATEHQRGDIKEFYISGFERIAEIVDMVLDGNKEFRPGHETLFSDCFLDELEHWDGWATQYYTNSARNAAFVSTVAALNDRTASTSVDGAGHWTVVLSHDTARTLRSCTITRRPSTEQVYCVTVPAGYVLTRRAGTISISGNSQFTGYIWGAKRSAGIELNGFLVRGVSILKTKYDTLQAITYRPDWQIDRWLDQVHRDIRRMKACWEEGYFDYNLDHACTEYGGCQFRQVCLTREPEGVLEALYQRRQWNPITRTETVL